MAHKAHHRTQKWYHTVFWSLIKFSVINSWIIYQKNTKSKITQANFIWNLCKQMHISKIPQKIPTDNIR
jgi:hypothetical protein